MSFLLDNEQFHFSEGELPLLISGSDGSGASLFSIRVIADLVKRGHRAVFFTAKPPAKEDLRRICNDDELARIHVIESGEEEAFVQYMEDQILDESVIVFVKNIDRYSTKLFSLVKERKNLILSGDVNTVDFAADLQELQFNAQIFFSPSETFKTDGLEELPKYSGLFHSDLLTGEIKLDQGV